MVYCTGLENRQTATSQRFQSFSLRKLALSHNGSAADSGSASGGSIPSGATSVRSFGRLGVCAGLKIPKTWFDSTRLHLKIRECSSGNEGGLEFLELAKNPLSDDFVGSSPTSRTQLALWYNGSTTGFGPVSEGSIPSGATSKINNSMV